VLLLLAFWSGLGLQGSTEEEDRVVAIATRTRRPQLLLRSSIHLILYTLACLVLMTYSVWAKQDLMPSRLSHLLAISVDQVVELSREHQLPPDSSMERRRQLKSEHTDLSQKY
jgi:hypothetical protein